MLLYNKVLLHKLDLYLSESCSTQCLCPHKKSLLNEGQKLENLYLTVILYLLPVKLTVHINETVSLDLT